MVEKKRHKKASVDTTDFAKKADLASLKSEVNKLDMDELQTAPIDLSNLSNVVDEVAKETVYEELTEKVNDIHVIDTIKLVTKAWW